MKPAVLCIIVVLTAVQTYAADDIVVAGFEGETYGLSIWNPSADPPPGK